MNKPGSLTASHRVTTSFHLLHRLFVHLLKIVTPRILHLIHNLAMNQVVHVDSRSLEPFAGIHSIVDERQQHCAEVDQASVVPTIVSSCNRERASCYLHVQVIEILALDGREAQDGNDEC
jgi:hypothetical protein